MSNNILNEKKKIRRWWDDDGDNIGYEPGEVSGRFRRKKKSVKEGFSNWRQDLSEVMSTIEKEENDNEITEKKVKNKIKINPNLGEAVEQLGGTLLEMTEIEDFEGVFDELSESDIFFLTDDLIEEVVEEVFEECLQEGYNIFEIENVLLESLEVSSALLNEANGHDTDVKSDRLEKVKSAVKKVGKGILRGAGYVAGAAVRGAKAVGRELSAGYKRGRDGSGGSSDSDSSSSGGSSKVTQGRGSSRPGLLGRIGSALKKGLKKVVAKGARAVSRGARSVARRMSDGESQSSSPSSTSKAKVTQGKGRERAADQQEPIKKVSVRDVTQTPKKPEARTGQPGPERKALPPAQSSSRRKKAAATAAAAAQGSTSSGVRVAGPGGVSPLARTKKAAETYSGPASGAPKRPARKTKVTAAKPAAKPKREPNPKKPGKPSLDDLLKIESFQLSEKAESKQQQKLFGLALSVKRGETPRSEVSAEVLKIVDDMSEKEIRKFAKTSHEGLPKKVQTKEEAIREALLDRMFEKIKQQLQEKPGDGYLGPTPIPNPIRLAQDTVDATNRTSQKKVDAVNKLLPGSASMPKTTYFNKGPSAASQKYLGLKNSYEPEGEMVDEAEHRIKKPAQYAKPRGTYDPTGIGVYPRTSKERKKMSRGEKVVPYKSLSRESD